MKILKIIAVSVVALFCSIGSTIAYDAYADAIARSVAPSKAIKRAIVAAARDILFDPYSVRDAEISNVADFGNGTQGVCVKVNAKNRMGGYTGRQSHAITLSGTILISDQVNHPLCARPDVKYRPFPELEALKDL